MPDREQGEVREIYSAVRTGCVGLLKAYGRKEASLAQVIGRNLLHISLRFVHGKCDLTSLWAPNSLNWHPEEHLFPIGQGLYVPGRVTEGEREYPAGIYTMVVGQNIETSVIRFLRADSDEHMVFCPGCAHIGIGPISSDLRHGMRDFKARRVEPDDAKAWLKKWESFQVAETNV